MARAFPEFVTTASRQGGNSFRVRIRETDRLPDAPDFPMTWEGIMSDGFAGRIYESDDAAFLIVEDKVAALLAHAEGRAEVYTKPGSEREFFVSASIPIVDSALAIENQHLVHAGCLVGERSGKAILICAHSGAGKTTTSIALARRGFALMTDDASVIVPGNGQPRVWALPRDLKVHRKTAELLPWIGPLADVWDANGEQGIPVAALRDRMAVIDPEPVELGAIVLLGTRSAAGHSLSPMSKPEMLVALAHDNVAQRTAGMTAKARHQFDVLADVVSRVPGFMLNAGEELDTLPELMQQVLHGRAASECAE